VVVVDISESSLSTLGPWPWPRPVLAQLAEALRARGARVQVWDIMLPEPAAGDERLALALSRPDVVLGQVLVTDPAVGQPPREGRLVPATSSFGGLCSQTHPVQGHLGVAPSLAVQAAGHVGATPDSDGRLRRLPAVLCHEGRSYPQLALAAAEAATPQQAWALERGFWPWQPAQELVRGTWRFPLDESGWLRVPYARGHQAWPAVRVEQVLDPSQHLPELQGSMVLIGATALGLADIVNTPFHPVAPGVSVHAELVAAAIPALVASPAHGLGSGAVGASAWVVQPRGAIGWTIGLVCALALVLALRLAPQTTARQAAVLSVGVVVLPALVAPLAREVGWMLPVLPLSAALAAQALCIGLFNMGWLRRQSTILARHLQGFMPPALAREIADRHPTSDSLGHAEHGTLMAVRIEGLERWQGSVEPLQALGLIHGLHATAQSAAAASGGRLEQAQGNTMMLAWPKGLPDGVRCALRAADRCRVALQPLLEQNETESHPLSMNIAIEFGPYLQGVVGHAESRRAVMLGAAVADVQGMLELSVDLATPVLLGPQAARQLHQDAVERLGTFILPEQAEPKGLFRLNAQPSTQPAPRTA
jgi:adenylate cyclase